MVKVIRKTTGKKEFDKVIAKLRDIKKFDAYKFCGVLKLNDHPVSIQTKMRNEWE